MELKDITKQSVQLQAENLKLICDCIQRKGFQIQFQPFQDAITAIQENYDTYDAKCLGKSCFDQGVIKPEYEPIADLLTAWLRYCNIIDTIIADNGEAASRAVQHLPIPETPYHIRYILGREWDYQIYKGEIREKQLRSDIIYGLFQTILRLRNENQKLHQELDETKALLNDYKTR